MTAASTGEVREAAGQVVPVRHRRARTTSPRAEQPEDAGRALEGAEHDRDPAVLAEVGDRLGAAAGEVEVGDRGGIEHPEGVKALGREVDVTVVAGGRGGHEEHRLAPDPLRHRIGHGVVSATPSSRFNGRRFDDAPRPEVGVISPRSRRHAGPGVRDRTDVQRHTTVLLDHRAVIFAAAPAATRYSIPGRTDAFSSSTTSVKRSGK